MNFDFPDHVKERQSRLTAFMDEHIYPNESVYYRQIEEDRALFQGLSFAMQEQLAQDQAAGFRAIVMSVH